jgi:hypothetical protein
MDLSPLATLKDKLLQRVPVTNVILKRLPEHGFVHGSALLGGRLATMLYFEEPRRGLISVIWSVSPPETKFARFLGQLLPRHGRPSAN